MEARISSIVRNTFTQMNFSTSTKDPKNNVKNVGETFATWYTQYRNIFMNSMADLPLATRITILLRGFNRSYHYLYSSYFQPMDPADLAYEKLISKVSLTDFALISVLVLSKKTNSDISFSFLVSDLLAMLRFNSDFSPSWTWNPMLRSLVENPNLLQDRRGRRDPLSIRQLSDKYQKQSLPRSQFCGEHRYHRNCPMEDGAGRIATTMAIRKTSTEDLLRIVQRGRTQATREH
ncbi:hypothetical protein ACTXT7_012202 [Hymenolepis weldensis]